MQETAIQAGAPPSPPPPLPPTETAVAPAEPRKVQRGLPYRVLEFCASLRITVVLFILAFLLVFYGTWAQVDAGIWTVVNKYFRSFFVMMPVKIVLLRAVDIPNNIAIPFPGGWTIGSLLLTNLLAAHAIRFKVTWKRSGILILHAGLIVMMLGEFFTGVFAIEGRMTIVEKFSSNYVDSDRHYELALVSRADAKFNDEIVIPGSKLGEGQVVRDEQLPFDVEVVRYMVNSDMRRPTPTDKNLATSGIGMHNLAIPKGETAGVDTSQSMETPSAYVKLTKKTGEPLGTYLVSTWFSFLGVVPDSVTVDGKKYELGLRAKRSYRDYTIKLNKFDHDVYPGTEIPRNYSSEITLVDPKNQEDSDVKIWMNHPLRYEGETFYQSGLHPLTKGTILQVVRNPVWTWPYWSCGLVTLGMLIHFGIALVTFLRKALA